MSTHNQDAHWNYTISEWKKPNYQEYLDIIFKDNNIEYICDIGANVGGTTKVFVDYIIENKKNVKKIYCFEPDIENMNFLKSKFKNAIEGNKITTINKGVYYGKTKAKVFGAGHIHENRIHPNVGGYAIEECMKEIVSVRNKRGESVFCGQVDNKEFELDTFENLIEKSITPDFVKIDIEGAEKNVLMNSELIKCAKFITLEWNQEDNLKDFIQQYLPNFKIIKESGDILLKNISLN